MAVQRRHRHQAVERLALDLGGPGVGAEMNQQVVFGLEGVAHGVGVDAHGAGLPLRHAAGGIADYLGRHHFAIFTVGVAVGQLQRLVGRGQHGFGVAGGVEHFAVGLEELGCAVGFLGDVGSEPKPPRRQVS